MLRKNLGLFIFLGVLVILIGYGCNGYNGLVNQDENVNQAWNNVQSDYQRRADLIPNLVNTVKGEANFEQAYQELDRLSPSMLATHDFLGRMLVGAMFSVVAAVFFRK